MTALPLDEIACCDALTYLAGLPSASVDCVITDPPYNGVKADAWDNQWRTDNDFLAWMDTLCQQWQRVLKPNGSLYVFASPRLGSRVELKIGEHFNVLNRITWKKPAYSTKAKMFDKDTMRCFFPASEVIIFAEKRDAMNITPIGNAIRESRLAKNIKATDVDIALGYVRTKDPTRGTELCRRWEEGSSIPSMQDFTRAMQFLHAHSKSYEDLRRQYEDLRRPFHASANAPYTDVWEYRTVNTYPGKHPAEKPISMMKHIVRTSTNHGAVVLDCFVGSGAILDAARQLGRHYIGCDFDPHWVNVANKRVKKPMQLELIPEDVATATVHITPIAMPTPYTLPMFA